MPWLHKLKCVSDAQPEGITGIVALGPYLGKRSVTEQVRAGGGLSRWQAPGGVLAADEIDLILWRWLQGGRVDGSGVPVPLHLGYGLADRFLVDDELLAATLPAERVFTAEGGHDWPAAHAGRAATAPRRHLRAARRTLKC